MEGGKWSRDQFDFRGSGKTLLFEPFICLYRYILKIHVCVDLLDHPVAL